MKKPIWSPLTSRQIKPEGWLRRQLEIQAKGLSGHLDQVWPDVRDSGWVGGDREGWERMPYWLDGFIPMAWLLEDEALMERGRGYIQAILSRQQPDGWICPCTLEQRPQYDVWTVFLICKVLCLYADCDGDPEKQVENAVAAALENLSDYLDKNTLFDWGASRWFECLLPLSWLYARRPEQWILTLAGKLRAQGINYDFLFDPFTATQPENKWTFLTHVVNLAMSLKQGAVSSLFWQVDPEAYADKALDNLMRYHGMAVEHFTGDECLSGDSPVQGTELCGVVEAMFSYEVLLSVTGNCRWADRLEKLAFNALPATISEDMWTHQYLQMTNQPQCSLLPEDNVIFRTNPGDSHLFGLEPNFGCCTANFSQGWPKLALSAFFETEDALVCAVPVPSRVETVKQGVPVRCSLDTAYPFKGQLRFTVETDAPVDFALQIRIPGFVKGAYVNGEPATPGTLYTVSRTWEGTRQVEVTFLFATELVSRPASMACLWRGPLLYALPITERWEKMEYEKNGVVRQYPYCDYQVYPESPWNYGFASTIFAVQEHEVGEVPFSRQQPPVSIEAWLAPVEWPFENGVCAPTPSHTPLGEPQQISMVPYGCARLRMTELPLVQPEK